MNSTSGNTTLSSTVDYLSVAFYVMLMIAPIIITLLIFMLLTHKDELKNLTIETIAKNRIGQIINLKNNVILHSTGVSRYRNSNESVAIVCDVEFSYDMDHCICGVTYKILTANGIYLTGSYNIMESV